MPKIKCGTRDAPFLIFFTISLSEVLCYLSVNLRSISENYCNLETSVRNVSHASSFFVLVESGITMERIDYDIVLLHIVCSSVKTMDGTFHVVC